MFRFEQVVVSLGGTWDPSLPIAAARAGALGILDLCYLQDSTIARRAVRRLGELAQARYGILLPGRLDSVTSAALEAIAEPECVVFLPDSEPLLAAAIAQARSKARRIGLVVTCIEDAELAHHCGVDFIFAKGHEAGGRVGEETSFVLLQRLLAWAKLPVYAWGGIGRHTIAAAEVAGAAGVVVDWQLALTRESPLCKSMQRKVAALDGSETALVRYAENRWFRFFSHPRSTLRAQLEAVADRCRYDRIQSDLEFDATLAGYLSRSGDQEPLYALGQDAAFASSLAKNAASVAGVLCLLDEARHAAVRGAARSQALLPGSSLAASHGTEFPVVQGPMTHVSDVPEFCYEVARNGALPFLALALMRGPALEQTLNKTKHLMGDLPWGVGILGFVPQELRAEQMAVVEETGPTHAIIAGGRPDQAASLESRGIQTYLHVPSPGMLDTFLKEGARRFVFEGRECGGHVGPRTSFVLWESMIEVLLNAKLSRGVAEQVHVLFAGGIHDARSAAMVAALAQPLVEAGIKIGVLLGTAYLSTREIVETGAVVDGFRDVTLSSDHTVLLETGPGHAIRCADTDFVNAFEQRKRELKAAGRSHEEIRDELEHMNLGRLRMASKGISRAANPAPGESPYCSIDAQAQREQGMYMLGQVAALRAGTCSLRDLHASVSTDAVDLLTNSISQVEVVQAAEPAPAPYDIAIVGLGCLLPGATDPADFWDNILHKRDLVTEVPDDRFDVERWFNKDPSARDKIYSRWGGFVPHILFDPMKYGIPPASLKSIEPMQLMALELVARALTDAGYADRNPLRARTSVILGVGGGAAELGIGYGFRSLLPKFFENPDEAILSELPEWTEDSFAGILLNVVAGRVANRFDLGGANFTVDAACASSLAAVYLACRELATHACDMVVTGGCDTMQGPMGYLCFAKTGALSPQGRSRPFEATADGIAISEGHAAVVLKRLADAQRDGDRIYAVIRAAAGGSDGRHKGLTAPRLEGQLQTLKRAYAQADFSPASVELFEAHGTGTAVGDLAECLALRGLLEDSRAERQSAALGSVKSMIGHTKCAAGVSGLVKTALALHHRVLPPTLHVQQPNPKAGLEDGPLYVNSELRPWLSTDKPRRAGVSAFGFGGSNFHVVLEEYSQDAVDASARMAYRQLPAELFVFTANSVDRLAQSVRSFAGELQSAQAAGADFSLADLAYSHHVRQSAIEGACRAAVVANSADELLKRLDQLSQRIANGNVKGAQLPGIYFTTRPLAHEGSLACLFPGQGSQHPDMLRELAVAFREVAETFEAADAALADCYESRLTRYIFPPSRFRDSDRLSDAEQLKQTQIAQPALGACGLAVWKLLQALGIRPGMVAGHSYGELVALHAAGCFDADTLFRLSRERGLAMQSGEAGSMLAVAGSAQQVRSALNGNDQVWLANMNSSRQTVISGANAAIEQAAVDLQQKGLTCQRIPVSCAFHTPLMASATQRFAQVVEQTAIRQPRLPVYSNLQADVYPTAEAELKSTLVGQIEHEVRFCEQIEAMYAAGARIFVEAGPGRVLAGLVKDILGDRPHVAVATQSRSGCGLTQLLNALGELIAHGVPVQLDRLYEGRALKSIQLRELTQRALAGPPAHLWWLHGSAVRPVGEAPRPAPERGRLVRPSDDRQETATAAISPAAGTHALADQRQHDTESFAEVEATEFTSPSYPSAIEETDSLRWAQPSSEASARAEAHAQFQQTMRQFLEVQRSVMLSFLGQPDAAISQSHLPERLIAPTNGEALEYTHQPPATPSRNGSHEHPAQPPVVEPAAAEAHVVQPQPAAQQPQASAPVVAPPSPVAAPASQAAASVALDEQLLAIVSQRTGYPIEMLDLDANMEADLGIDSIKRVEIISAFRRETLPEMTEPPAAFMERMTAAKTMRAILDVVRDFQGQQSPATEVAAVGNNGRAKRSHTASVEANGEAVSAPRCVPAVVEAPLTTPGTLRSMHGLWVVTDDRLGAAHRLVDAVAALGGQCAILAVEDLSDPQSAVATVEQLRTQGLPIRGLFHLAPFADAPTFPQVSEHDWHTAVDAEVKSLLYLLQACAGELTAECEEPFTVICATRGAGDFGDATQLECAHPWRGGLAGMLKVAAREYPQARARTIDFTELPDPQVLLAEAQCAGAIEVGYRDGRRLQITAVREEHPSQLPSDPAVDLNRDSIVLVLAGAKGITASVACEMAQQTQATFVLAGRSPLPEAESPATADCTDPLELRRRILASLREQSGSTPDRKQVEQRFARIQSDREILHTLSEIRAAGSQVEYIPCDVQNVAQLESLVASVRQRYGRIDAIVHGAGVIEDKYIVDKTPESFDRVVDTKVEPLLTLSRILPADELKLLVIFSSVSGFFGNPGQVDYSTANEMLNRMARRLRDLWSAKVISLCWGPWTGAGMVKAEVAKQFQDRGVGMITVPAGRRAAWNEIVHHDSRDVRVILGPGVWIAEAEQTAREGIPLRARTPLLHGQPIWQRRPTIVEVELTLDAAQHIYLRDHIIDGKAVLPLAFALECMAELAAVAEPELQVSEIVDLRQLKGIVLPSGPHTLPLRAERIERTRDGAKWRVRLQDPSVTSRPHYEAVVVLSKQLAPPPAAPEESPLGGEFPLDTDEGYRRWLFHGPLFQVIDLYRGYDERGVDCIVRPSNPAACMSGATVDHWLIDPVIIDVGPQLAALWSRATTDTMLLPSRVASFRRYATVGSDPLECYFRVTKTDGSTVTADVRFVRDGQIICQFTQLECAGSRELNRITGGVLV